MKSILVALVALTLAIAACGSDDAPDTPDTDAGGPVTSTAVDGGTATGAWVLVSGEVDGAALDPPDTHRITLVVEDANIGGQAACNSYGGTMTVDGGVASITDLAWTEMACQPPSVMDIEQRYLAGLVSVDEIEATPDTLTFRGVGTELTFEPLEEVDEQSLVGTMWTLDTLIDGDTASSVGGEPATLLLTSDGSLEGSTGCRDIVGEYQIIGDEVMVVEMAAIGNCGSRLLPQDGLVLEVLGDGFTPSVDGTQLTLSSQGGVGLTYTAG